MSAWQSSQPNPNRRIWRPVHATTSGFRSEHLAAFAAGLGRAPYTWSRDDGFAVRRREHAADAPNIAHGLPTSSQWLAIDVDRPFDPADLLQGAPAPHVVCVNPENGHWHGLFHLAFASRLDRPGYRALRRRLDAAFGADRAYSGRLTKNPLRPDLWEVLTRSAKPWTFKGLYARLPQAAAHVQAEMFPACRASDAPGRNVFVFDTVRFWAYPAARDFQTPEALYEACLAQACQVPLARPLPARDLHHLAKSIAGYTWEKFGPDGNAAWVATVFIPKQAARGRLGGRRSGEVRRHGSIEQAEPWVALGISRATWFRRKALGIL